MTAILKLNLDERRTRVRERDVKMVSAALLRALGCVEAGLTYEQIIAVRSAFAEEIGKL
jgi:hypothetical protein